MTNIIKFEAKRKTTKDSLGSRQQEYCDVILLSSGDIVKDAAMVEYVSKAVNATRLPTWLTPDEYQNVAAAQKQYYVLDLATNLYNLAGKPRRSA